MGLGFRVLGLWFLVTGPGFWVILGIVFCVWVLCVLGMLSLGLWVVFFRCEVWLLDRFPSSKLLLGFELEFDFRDLFYGFWLYRSV